ncbi:MAG: copper resistance protein NlpE N-terminal domain-containing protein [Alistipes ihumii]
MKKQLVTASLLALLAASCGHRTDRSTAAPDSSKPAAAASAQATDTAALGPEMLRTYEGLLPAADGPGIRYELTLENREHSGDGTYRLAMTYLEAENGRDTTFFERPMGTLRGTDDDPDATVYQLNIGDTTLEQINFLSYPDSLIMLGADMAGRVETQLYAEAGFVRRAVKRGERSGAYRIRILNTFACQIRTGDGRP